MKSTSQANTRQYRFYWLIVCLYVTMQLVSDITAGKITTLAGFPVSVTVLYFPITYIFADVLTEVYGYSRARRAVWVVLGCSVLAGALYQVAAYMPAAAGFTRNDAYVTVLTSVPRIPRWKEPMKISPGSCFRGTHQLSCLRERFSWGERCPMRPEVVRTHFFSGFPRRRACATSALGPVSLASAPQEALRPRLSELAVAKPRWGVRPSPAASPPLAVMQSEIPGTPGRKPSPDSPPMWSPTFESFPNQPK
jgi:Putative vitamin uptake transporter